MVELVDSDIRTREVCDWQGLHLFHFESSSCSEKIRIFLDMKGLQWESHPVNLDTLENYSEWYMGINPRGLVPALVHDGRVHIESNDIISYLERTFPKPALIPANKEKQIARLLKRENDLHPDLRTLTFGLLPLESARSDAELASYEQGGSGTVGGIKDKHKREELAFWRSAAELGISHEQIAASAQRFQLAFTELETIFQSHACLLGDDPSVVDIAWYIYCNRLLCTGYPLEELHPRVSEWFTMLDTVFEWSAQIPDYDRVPKKPEPGYIELVERKQTFRKITGLGVNATG